MLEMLIKREEDSSKAAIFNMYELLTKDLTEHKWNKPTSPLMSRSHFHHEPRLIHERRLAGRVPCLDRPRADVVDHAGKVFQHKYGASLSLIVEPKPDGEQESVPP